ncbi:MAG: WYL domain-containing transcriptional regulator [Lachnospiraceae bacterium]|nr:WYL domain-containing transcriptional regulator [Lachnospiraceae bacterium]
MKSEPDLKEGKSERVMELLYRALKGEELSASKLADEYHVSARSITRDIDSLKCFMADRPEMFYGTELVYSSSNHSYTLKMDTLLSDRELISIAKLIVGCRVFSKDDLVIILAKLEAITSPADRAKMKELLNKEILHYKEPGSDCQSVIDNIWKLTECINNRYLISVYYHRMDRSTVDRRLMPVSIMFSESYFYLIAYRCDKETGNLSRPLYYRIDRISSITVHRQKYDLEPSLRFDEGELRNRSQFMWPGPDRHIRFEFTGPSVQAILDRLPTAKIISCLRRGGTAKYIIEADTTGNGIKMFLLSQGSWVRVLEPKELREEMQEEVRKMFEGYEGE